MWTDLTIQQRYHTALTEPNVLGQIAGMVGQPISFIHRAGSPLRVEDRYLGASTDRLHHTANHMFRVSASCKGGRKACGNLHKLNKLLTKLAVTERTFSG